MKNDEHKIQVAICRYLDYKNISYFAVPNGGMRNIGVARKLKAEGVKAGVADLFIMQPNEEFNGLFIEVKTATGRQQETQKNFEKLALANNYQYKIIRSVEEFIVYFSIYSW